MADNIAVTPGTGATIAADDIGGGVLVQRTKPTFGADGTATDISSTTPLPTYAPSGLKTVSATFNRPADTTAYAVGDLVANSTTAGSVTGLVFSSAVRAAGEEFRVEGVRLRKSGPSLTNATFRVYLCRQLPTMAVGDNAAFNTANVLGVDDIQYVVDWFDIIMNRAGTAGARGTSRAPAAGGTAITLSPASGTTLYAIVEALGAYTPVSGETFTCVLEGLWS